MTRESPATDVADLLDADSVLGLTKGTDLFGGFRPPASQAKEFVSTMLSPVARDNIRTFDGQDYERPRVQVLVHYANYNTAYAKAQSILDFLGAYTGSTVNGSVYSGAFILGHIIPLGQSEADSCWEFTVNVEMHRTSA